MGSGSSLGPKSYEKKSKLAHVRGNGSSYRGAHEWLTSRITATLSLLPSIYVIINIIMGCAASYESFQMWLSNPFNGAMIILALVTLCWHGALGVITVINDYVHSTSVNFTLTLLVKAFFSFIVILSSLSILKVML
jgi:succinate dehydrogenase / fumarate reductase membrane anchor subunit